MSADRKLALMVMFKGVDGLSGVMGKITGATGKAQGALRKLTDEARAQRAALRMTQESLATASGNVTQLMNAESRLEAQLAKTNARIKSQRDMLAKQARADARGQALQSSGTQQLMIGAGMAVPLVIAGKAAMDFESGMIDIQQKADLSAKDTLALKNNILAAAAAAKQLPENMRMGVDFLAGAGMDPRDAVQMIGPIGRAATAYRASIEDLSKASFALHDNLKVPLNETAVALDAMAKAGKDGNFEIGDMAQYFPSLTASAQALGQKGVPAVADLAAALEIARKGAGTSEEAATNVKDLLTQINTERSIKKFAKFGIDLPKAMKKAYADGKTPLEGIAELTQKATGGDLSKIPLLFQNQEAASAVRSLIQNMDAYRKMRADALAAAGTVDADFALRSKSAAANTQALEGSLGKLAITVGDKLLPKLTPLIDDATLIITKTADWADKHPHLTDVIVLTVAAVAALNIAMGAGKILYGTVIGPLQAAANAYTVLKESTLVAGIVSAVTDGIAASWGIITAASVPFCTAMFASAAAIWAVAWPVLAVIAAIALLVAAVIGIWWAFKHWDKIKQIAADVWHRLGEIMASIDWLKVGGNIIMGIVNGLIFAIPNLLIAMGKVALAGVAYFKKVLGIKSPSRLFMQFGGHITEGLAQGLDRGTDRPMRSLRGLAAGVAVAGSALAPGMASTAPAAPHMQFGDVTIVIHAAPGQSPADIAQAVKTALQDHAGIEARSSYRDDDA